MQAIRTAEPTPANESLTEAHHEITPLSPCAHAARVDQLRCDRAGAAGDDNYDRDAGSNDDRTEHGQRSLCHADAAGRARRVANGFTRCELRLDPRLLALDRHQLR